MDDPGIIITFHFIHKVHRNKEGEKRAAKIDWRDKTKKRRCYISIEFASAYFNKEIDPNAAGIYLNISYYVCVFTIYNRSTLYSSTLDATFESPCDEEALSRY